jgi:AcrR family transcriptional regulator
VGVRDQKKQVVRASIIDAAHGLFAERSFDEVTVAEVAERAGVSPATVARYFPAKEGLLFADVELRTAALKAAIVSRPREESPWQAVTSALAEQPPVEGDSRRRMLASRRAIARSSTLRGRAGALLDEWRTAVAAGVEARGAPPDEARALATAAVALMEDAADRWAATGGRTDIRADVRAAFDAMERTL